MATRRPASSRARANPMPPPPPRSRSVLAKPASHTATPDSGSILGESSTSNRGQKEESGTNIQVVIRCRRRSEQEIQENSPIIVTSTGAKSKELSIETGSAQSSLGVVTQAPTRTYPYDLVFGPEADQSMIYHDVVSPMLEQVLQGYNCTLFAYGQTGTGKTYTMQGDLNPSPMGNPSAHAGMIPRVLFRLFHQLEKANADFSVKISFVELYNEELRDLLASDLSAPTGSTQPMGFGGKGTDNGLKMFDEAGKRGIFIQGLEEIAVKDSKAALALLVKGSERRQIASTNFNEHSSRSHSVFSITVHTKDVSFGEDLLKTGKLHLVDLAGSENIGRSGAENKRAREAGMINQSLLTLGRVINALVDKATHVPYRESKLTRLLQDSLGGRTKTCIIATVSPARSNMEETLSTLDYALRAKSIRNKPEVNQRMSRNALLKEYIGEIDRLKADLLAAREKNGIFFSEDSWNAHMAEDEMKKTEMLEAKKQAQIIESQLRQVREEFEQSLGLLMKRDVELKETKDRLEKTEVTLEQKERHLKQTTTALQEEEVIRKSYQESEKNLDGVAKTLKTTLVQSTHHIEGLHAKIERKANVLTTNSRLVSKHGQQLASSSKDISKSFDHYLRAATDLHHAIETQTQDFSVSQAEHIAEATSQMDEQFKTLQQQFQSLAAGEEADTKLFTGLQESLEQAHSAFEDELANWGESVKDTVQQSCGEASTTANNQMVDIGRAVDSLQAALESIVRQAKGFVEEQRHLVAEIKEYSNAQAAAEIARLKKQNQMLSQMIASERDKANVAKDDLVQRVTGLLDNFLQGRDDSLKSATRELQRENDGFASAKKVEQTNHLKTCDAAETRIQSFDGALQQRVRENKRKHEEITKTIEETTTALDGAFNNLRSTVQENAEASSSTLREIQAEGLEEHARLKRIRLETTRSMQANVESADSFVQSALALTSSDIETFTNNLSNNLSELQDLTSSSGDNTLQGLSTVHEVAVTLLDKGTREDMPTGSTPQKRPWKYVESWKLAKGREELFGKSHESEPEPEGEAEAEEVASKPRHSDPLPALSMEVENRAPPAQPAPRPSSMSIPRPAKQSMASPPLSVKVEEKEVPLVESRRRNVSTRLRRQG
ncbi:hypothetical protein D9611_004710 [Ephemerocybe angulata]|uniref:Kinesin motor domain-containing protein n=1 Tax=Ephemerocybe angulata TaxID=980116 RepID=A0A8H5B3H1_9AGAR|nr:hypothetical protein D9611_004710 [Tulosesus angulatus]